MDVDLDLLARAIHINERECLGFTTAELIRILEDAQRGGRRILAEGRAGKRARTC